MDDAAGPVPFDSPMWIASCTKLLTTISVLQYVHDGLLYLDSDVSSELYELKDIDIFTGFDKDVQPTLVKPKNMTGPRQLLTHSANMAYDLFNRSTQVLDDQSCYLESNN